MKRIIWTVGMAAAACLLRYHMEGIPRSGYLVLRDIGFVGFWAACIGYGFGSIFQQPPQPRQLVIYWTVTLGLVGAFFGPLVPQLSFPAQEILSSAVGASVGLIVGMAHLRTAGLRNSGV